MGLLKDSISIQKRSDVAVGTFLSGGIDSSFIVALLSEQLGGPVRTFSTGFDGGLNELPYAKMVAERFGTDHTELMIKGSELPSVIPEIIGMMDEPISDNSIVPTYMLSKMAVKCGVKGGFSYGQSDEIGHKAAVDKVHVNDFHATILHLLGFDHKRLTYYHNGLERRLTVVAGEVIRPILA